MTRQESLAAQPQSTTQQLTSSNNRSFVTAHSLKLSLFEAHMQLLLFLMPLWGFGVAAATCAYR